MHLEANMIETITLHVLGMKCSGCENNVSTRLNALGGVLAVRASSKDKQVVIDFDTDKTTVEQLKNTIKLAGYSTQ